MRPPLVLLLILPFFGQGVPLPDIVVLEPDSPSSRTSPPVTPSPTAVASVPVTTQTKTMTPMQRIIVGGGVGLAYVASRKYTKVKSEKAAAKAAGEADKVIYKEPGIWGALKVFGHPNGGWREGLLRGWRRQTTAVRAPLDPLAA